MKVSLGLVSGSIHSLGHFAYILGDDAVDMDRQLVVHVANLGLQYDPELVGWIPMIEWTVDCE